MKRVYDLGERGAIDGALLKSGYRIQTERTRRPGKQVTDDTIVRLANLIMVGHTLESSCRLLSINRKTGSRWLKRLGFKMKRVYSVKWIPPGDANK